MYLYFEAGHAFWAFGETAGSQSVEAYSWSTDDSPFEITSIRLQP